MLIPNNTLYHLKYWYKKEHGVNDDSGERILHPQFETETEFVTQNVKTDIADESKDISRDTAVIGHRDDYKHAIKTGCPVRIRLTPSEPSKVGSFWYEYGLPVHDGFECGFTFQVRINDCKSNPLI